MRQELQNLLGVAGYSLSDTLPQDIVYRACFQNGVYEREHIEALLREFGAG